MESTIIYRSYCVRRMVIFFVYFRLVAVIEEMLCLWALVLRLGIVENWEVIFFEIELYVVLLGFD